MRNAALSVRNLKRSLRVLETLGVDPSLGASADLMDQVPSRNQCLMFAYGRCCRGVDTVGTDAWGMYD